MIYEDFAESTRSYWLTISQCAWCHSVKVGKTYIRIPRLGKITYQQAFRLPFGTSLCVITTHGLCPSCADRVAGHTLSL